MKKKIIYILLSLIIIYQIGKYAYHQYQYQKFEKFFMEARIYGGGKIVPDNTFTKMNKELKLKVKEYKYTIFFKSKLDKTFSGELYFRTSFDENFKIIGGGFGGNFLNNNPMNGIENISYLKFIPEKWIPNKKSAFYLIVEYEKQRQIRYYFEITEKVENGIYTIYFKSNPPEKILNANNKYIKE